MDDELDRRPFGSVINEAVSQFASLMRLDVRLLEAEMKKKGSDVLSSGVCGIAAVSFFILGAFALVEFLILAMVLAGVSAIFACLIVGILLFAAGFVSLRLAKRALVGWTLTPEHTVRQVRSDLAALKQGIRHGASQ
ncbi:phage holin family protein [Mesorhizobium sp. AR07]|uniref:phage holin family protein n=1 Tax=Mesorhizobium sp. AR07 TaxID=2865838 RepID=UPI00215E90E0|nr:phage holin family protein [Mesorhizobium sp. AR07]UVK46738.1 phage holin family protein [Mesorhizobium sp. AR07]